MNDNGRVTAYGGGGGSVQEIFMQPKNVTTASFQPKNISSFYT